MLDKKLGFLERQQITLKVSLKGVPARRSLDGRGEIIPALGRREPETTPKCRGSVQRHDCRTFIPAHTTRPMDFTKEVRRALTPHYTEHKGRQVHAPPRRHV